MTRRWSFNFNVSGAYVGEHTPVFLEDEEYDDPDF